MKQKLNFATWWRYISRRTLVENAIFILWPLKWHPQVVIINICFMQTTLNFLPYHMQKKLYWRRFSGLLYKIWRPERFFVRQASYDMNHIMLKTREVKICEHSIFFNYWTKICLRRHWKFACFIDITVLTPGLLHFWHFFCNSPGVSTVVGYVLKPQ